MNLAGEFVSTAGQVGLLAQFTYYVLLVTALAFFGGFVYFLGARNQVLPEHRAGMTLHAIICGVAGLSYLKIQDNFNHLLQVASTATGNRTALMNQAYLAIGQTRYFDWTITTPLLLLATVLVLRVRTRHVLAPVLVMMVADALMVATGLIGENQVTAAGDVLVGPRLLWGTVSTVFYLITVFILFTRFRTFQKAAHHEEAAAFRIAALATVTTWGIYPLGYLAVTFLPTLDWNWLHVTFSVFDLINKIGIGVVTFWAAASVYEKRHPSQDNPAAGAVTGGQE